MVADVPSPGGGAASAPPRDASSASRDAQGEMYSPARGQPSSLSLWFSRIIPVLDQTKGMPRSPMPPDGPPASPSYGPPRQSAPRVAAGPLQPGDTLPERRDMT